MIKKKVLIAEDDVLISEELQDIITNFGYDVVGIAEDFESAKEIIQANPPDIALLDINMQGREQGFEIALHLKNTLNIPYIFLTSYVDTKTLEKAGDLSPSAYLTKPFSKEQIFSALKVALMLSNSTKEIVIKNGRASQKVAIDDILWVKVDGIYIELQTKIKKILMRTSILIFLKEYDMLEMIRIHRSYAINMKNIDSISHSHVIINNKKLPISRSLKDNVFAEFMKISDV